MTVTEILCRFLVETNYNEIPRNAVKIAKERMLDTVGVTLAGAVEPAGAGGIAIELVRELGGVPTSSVIAGGFKTSASNAGLANGTSSHTLDYDDTSTYTVCHYSGTLVPTVLALGEKTKTSGKKLLEAFILAWEVGTRIGGCLGGIHYYKIGFHPVGTWPCLGCAAASAKLLNLDLEQTRTALGIAASAASGIRKQYGTNTKPLHSGYAARNGIIAALLAKKGFTANKDVLDRDPEASPTAHMSFSFPVVFAGEGHYDLSKITKGLGKSYNLISQPVTTKFHPGPTSLGVFEDLVINMMKKNSISIEQVENVEIRATRGFIDVCSTFFRPQTGDEARYSVNYQVAVAMLDGNVGIEQHRRERVHSSDVQEMMQRVHVSELKGSEAIMRSIVETGDMTKMGLGELTIKLKDGREFTGKGEQPKGSGDFPLERQDLLDKYEDCAKRVLSPSNVERTVELIENLEKLANITELMDLLR
jgi:2-methylcitrate dehydratase PrpD